MLKYFYVSLLDEQLSEINFVTCGSSIKEVISMIENEPYLKSKIIKKIKDYTDPDFFIVEPILVKKETFGYSIKKQFFKEGLIGTEIEGNTYYFKYSKNISNDILLFDSEDIEDSIGFANVFDIQGQKLFAIELSEIDEGHLADRLTSAIIKIHESLTNA